MADNSFMGILIGFILFTLVMAMVLTFSNGFANNYNTTIEEMSGGSFNLTDYYESMEDIESTAEGYRERFESGDIEDVDDATGIFSISNDMKSMIGASYTLLTQTLSNVLHVPEIAINIILGLIVSLAFVFLVWRLGKLGY